MRAAITNNPLANILRCIGFESEFLESEVKIGIRDRVLSVLEDSDMRSKTYRKRPFDGRVQWTVWYPKLPSAYWRLCASRRCREIGRSQNWCGFCGAYGLCFNRVIVAVHLPNPWAVHFVWLLFLPRPIYYICKIVLLWLLFPDSLLLMFRLREISNEIPLLWVNFWWWSYRYRSFGVRPCFR